MDTEVSGCREGRQLFRTLIPRGANLRRKDADSQSRKGSAFHTPDSGHWWRGGRIRKIGSNRVLPASGVGLDGWRRSPAGWPRGTRPSHMETKLPASKTRAGRSAQSPTPALADDEGAARDQRAHSIRERTGISAGLDRLPAERVQRLVRHGRELPRVAEKSDHHRRASPLHRTADSSAPTGKPSPRTAATTRRIRR